MRKFLFLLVGFYPMFLFGQAEGIVADHLFDNFEYKEAIHYYLRADELSTDQEANLAYAYYALKDFKNAAERFKVIIDKGEDIDPIFYYFYGNSLKNSGQFDEARIWLNKSLEQDSSQYFVQNSMRSIDVLRKDDPSKYVKEVIGLNEINNGASTYSPQWYKNGVIFCSEYKIDSAKRRPMVDVGAYSDVDKLNYGLAERPLSQIYYIEVESFKVAKSELIARSDKFHISSFYVNDDEIYFTKIDLIKGWDPSLKSHPRLFYGKLNSGDKTIADPSSVSIKKLSGEAGSGHPCLSSDGKTIYFSSDRPGGFGGADLYKTTIDENGKWSEPENLGPQINTKGDELYPTINGDEFFFSSDGHVGFGGLDIYKVSWANILNSKPKLVEAPINSVGDDFGLIINPTDTNQGFFTSNRFGGLGDDDLYMFRLKLDGLFVQGIVKDINGNPVANALVKIYDENGNEVAQVRTDENGKYILEVDNNGSYQVVATIPGYGDKELVKIDENWDNYSILEMTLEPMLTAQGVVKNEDGTNAANVDIELWDDQGNLIFKGKTDENGYYQFPLDENKTYTAKATDGVLTGEKIFTTNSEFDTMENRDIQLSAGTFVAGVVLDENGNPLSGVEVKLFDENGNLIASVITDENGAYHFDLERDKNYQLLAEVKGFEALENIYTGDNYDSNDQLDLHLEPVGKESFALVEDKSNKQGIANVKVTLVDDKTGKKFVTTTDENGKFTVNIKPKSNYTINLDKDGYYPKSVSIKAGKLPEKVDLNKMGDFGMDYAGFKVKKIYFELDRYVLTSESKEQLDVIVDVLKKNPNATITVKSYADCRGNDKYNVSLSWKRSKAVKEYLIEKGIKSNRILTESLGATNFINNCTTPDACTEEEHALNRRSEFEINFNNK